MKNRKTYEKLNSEIPHMSSYELIEEFHNIVISLCGDHEEGLHSNDKGDYLVHLKNEIVSRMGDRRVEST